MYYLILNLTGDRRVGFSTSNHDLCFGHTKPAIIADYTLADYLKEFGNELVVNNERDENYRWKDGQITLWKYLQNCNYSLRLMTMEQFIA